MPDQDTLQIDRRFCGPPDSGNGGYVCGRLAAFVDSESVVVRLHVPPPLNKRLNVERDTGSARLLDGDLLVAEARSGNTGKAPGHAPDFAAAKAASRHYPGFERHAFPTCFVCGPDRKPDDGLCIFPGPVDSGLLVAAPWTPHVSLATADGEIHTEFLWAALDCPGAFSFRLPDDRTVLLGELEVTLLGRVNTGERCVLTGEELSHDGRKHHTLTALYGESGTCRGYGRATWIEIPVDAMQTTA